MGVPTVDKIGEEDDASSSNNDAFWQACVDVLVLSLMSMNHFFLSLQECYVDLPNFWWNM